MSLAQQLVAELTVQNDIVLASYAPTPTAGKLYNNAGVLYWGASPIAAGGGTVTSFSAGNLIPLFSTSVATATSTPALTFALSTVAANKVLAGPTTGADAAWAARLLVAADIPDLSAIYQPLLAYTPENVANKSTSGALGVSDTLYPSQKAVKTYADTKASATLTAAHILVGNGSNVATDVAMSGDVSILNTGATTVGGLLTKALPALSTTALLRYNGSAWAWDSSAYITGNQTITLSGNVTGSGTTAITTTIAANAVTLAMMATQANNTVLGNISGGVAVPSALTLAQTLGMDTTVTPQFARLGLGHAADASVLLFIQTDNNTFWSQAATGTSRVYNLINNGGGALYFGVERSAGGGIFTGTTAYATVLGNAAANPIQLVTNDTVRMTIGATGGVQFNQYGAGTLVTDSSGNITASSDERIKDILGDFTTAGLAAVRKLHPKKYHWKESTGLCADDLNVSLTAQDLLQAGITEAVFTQRTLPVMEDVVDAKGKPILDERGRITQCVKHDLNGRVVTQKVDASYTVSDRAVIATLVNAIKELADQVDELKKK